MVSLEAHGMTLGDNRERPVVGCDLRVWVAGKGRAGGRKEGKSDRARSGKWVP